MTTTIRRQSKILPVELDALRVRRAGVEGLTSRYRGRPPWKLTAQVRARVLAATRLPPPDGSRRTSAATARSPRPAPRPRS